ncbi:MAG: DUF928 domain-containing protein [Cyanobacteria bacterium P01_D01_bin.44]
MMKRPQQSFNIATAFLTLLGLALTLSPPAVSMEGLFVSQSIPPDPPSAPPPRGRRQPGGSLGDEASCPAAPKPLTALIPDSGLGQTLADEPTFWFYSPYTAEEVQLGEFSILTQDETQRVYKTHFTLPARPGFVSIQVPRQAASNLIDGQYYHWYLNLYCGSTAQPDLKIDGWVQPLPRTAEHVQQANNLSSDLWYDVVSTLAEQLQSVSPALVASEGPVSPSVPVSPSPLIASSPWLSPNEAPSPGEVVSQAVASQRWAELLDEVNLADFVNEPVVGPVLTVDIMPPTGPDN